MYSILHNKVNKVLTGQISRLQNTRTNRLVGSLIIPAKKTNGKNTFEKEKNGKAL